MKARMIIGGLLDTASVREVSEVLADADLWVCISDSDDDPGNDPHADDDWSSDNPEWWWAAVLEHLAGRDASLILTVEDTHYDYNQHPLDSVDAFEAVSAVCEKHGLFYRIITPGGYCEQTNAELDRRVETLAPSGHYKGYVNLNGCTPVIGITEQLMQDPTALMQTAKHAWMAAAWPIPKLHALVYV